MKILQLIIHDPKGNEIRKIQLKEKGLTLVYGNGRNLKIINQQ